MPIQRAKRSETVDKVTLALVEKFNRKIWTIPDLQQNKISITRSALGFMRCSGLIASHGYTREKSTGNVFMKWSITEKGMNRSRKVKMQIACT